MINWNLLERDHYYRGIRIDYFLKGKSHCQMGCLPRLFALLSLQTSENFVVFPQIDLVINGAESISYWETKIWEMVTLYYSNPVCFNILNNLLYSYVLFVYFWCHGSLVLACKIFFNWDIGTTEWSHFG